MIRVVIYALESDLDVSAVGVHIRLIEWPVEDINLVSVLRTGSYYSRSDN